MASQTAPMLAPDLVPTCQQSKQLWRRATRTIPLADTMSATLTAQMLA
jgi:hypothetical protein